jgi:hypothetical protein
VEHVWTGPAHVPHFLELGDGASEARHSNWNFFFKKKFTGMLKCVINVQ